VCSDESSSTVAGSESITEQSGRARVVLLKKQLRDCNRLLAERDVVIQQLQSQLTQHDAAVTQLQAQLTQRDAAVTQLQAQLESEQSIGMDTTPQVPVTVCYDSVLIGVIWT
jgi:chromosome segregation ATPase